MTVEKIPGIISSSDEMDATYIITCDNCRSVTKTYIEDDRSAGLYYGYIAKIAPSNELPYYRIHRYVPPERHTIGNKAAHEGVDLCATCYRNPQVLKRYPSDFVNCVDWALSY